METGTDYGATLILPDMQVRAHQHLANALRCIRFGSEQLRVGVGV